MSTDLKNIWVFVDHMESRVRPVSLELLGEARRIANETRGQVDAVVFGKCSEQNLGQIASYGADRIRVVETRDSDSYEPDIYTSSLGTLCQSHKPDLVLFPATTTGADLSARIATAHLWPIFPRAISIRLREGVWEVTRALAAGKVHARLIPLIDGPCFVTFAPDVIGISDEDPTREAKVTQDACATPSKTLIEMKDFIRATPDTIDLAEAEIVVSAGRGLCRPENIGLVEDLAAALGGSVGGTRVVVDLGWLPKERQVGQTGKTVRPRLYIACGLSGATQHIMGMKQSETIVAINTDPGAPIFKIADLAATVDAIQILPILAEKCARKVEEDKA